MVAITAGAFWMGCNNCPESAVKDESCDGDEHSYHKVYLDGYDIDRTEIRADQYAMCVAAGGCTTPGTGADSTWQKPEAGDHPINYVSWWQVEDFCGWVGKRLCSEAEWEMGARGDCDQNGGDAACEAQSRKYPWGNDPPSCSLAVMDDCPEDSQPVCSLPLAGTVPYGLCDMAGNVWEWVADRHLGDYYCEGPAASGGESCPPSDTWPGSPEAWANPPGPAQGTARVYRGGSFNSFADPLRVSERMYGDPSAFFGTLGGRCCRSAQP
jgi:formylglycine-generating enzyme required for sulfatase activity